LNDSDFLEHVADRLMGLPAVEAVALGGSRATGTNRPDSDWDFAVYYRGDFDPQDLRDVGWPGEVSEIGGWGGGVYNGGAWLTIDDRKVDVHYRDLQSVEHEMSEAAAGRVHFEPLLFHLAGIATYLVVAELAQNQAVRGRLPRPAYPEALSRSAPVFWWDRADLLFGYSRVQYAARGRVAQAVGVAVEATTCAAHAVMSARSEWVTNEKGLLARAGLEQLDRLVLAASEHPTALQSMVDDARALGAGALAAALIGAGYPEAVQRLGLL
jgi:predicted nucleotidyltransferase